MPEQNLDGKECPRCGYPTQSRYICDRCEIRFDRDGSWHIDTFINVKCTWGEGPDVLMTFQGKPFNLHQKPILPPDSNLRHGHVYSGSVDLTAEQGMMLAIDLLSASLEAAELDFSYQIHQLKDEINAVHPKRLSGKGTGQHSGLEAQGDKPTTRSPADRHGENDHRSPSGNTL